MLFPFVDIIDSRLQSWTFASNCCDAEIDDTKTHTRRSHDVSLK